jgi:predicted GIY-YIG superfamily endonuclease
MLELPKRTVYVLRSLSIPARHHVGLTANLPRRIAGHNAGQNTQTARNRPRTVVVVIEFSTEDAAVRFERYLKSASGRAFAKRHLA